MAESSAVDAAVIGVLATDAELTALMPGGVWWALAPADRDLFVLVSHAEHADAYALPGGVLWERFEYLVKAVQRGTSGAAVDAAAARIHALLQDAALTVAGYYAPMLIQRVRVVRYPEVDEVTDQRWQHQGAYYELMITPS